MRFGRCSGHARRGSDVLGRSSILAPSLLVGDGRELPFPDGSIDCLLNTYTFEVLGEGRTSRRCCSRRCVSCDPAVAPSSST